MRLLVPGAVLPARATEGDAGLDLHAVEPAVIGPGERAAVGTGIAVEIPPGMRASSCRARGWRSGMGSRSSTPPA